MRTTHILIFFLGLTSLISAQKEDFIWSMGNGDYKVHREGGPLEEHTGNTFIDFHHEPPLIYQDEDSHNQYKLANGQIATPDGEPLLYCNGLEVTTYLKDTLDGGGVISHSQLWEDLVSYSDGIRLTSGSNTSQSIVFVQIPQSEDEYFLLYSHLIVPASTKQLFHAKIDMSLNNGAGKAIYIDSIVRPNIEAQLSFHLRPVRHANGRDWWILAPDIFEEKIHRMLISPEGISFHGEQSFKIAGLGQTKYSPDGRYMVMSSCVTLFSPNNPDNTIHIYEVDRCTGELVEVFSETLADCLSTTGAGFSPDSRYMFYTNIDEVLQVDLWAEPIGRVVHRVWVDEGQRDNVYSFNAPFEPRHMQLGPDNRMYVPAGGRAVINIMHKPWLPGEEAEWEDFAIITPTPIFPATPNILNPRLGPVDGSACDTLGIDNNPVAGFRYTQDDTLSHLDIGFVDLSYMAPTLWEWDFGDGATSTERYPEHSYAENGIYVVCLTVSNENSSDTVCKTLLLGVTNTTEEAPEIQPYVSIYPQPVTDYMRVAIHDYLPQSARFLMLDVQGQVVLEKKLSGQESSVDLSLLSGGIYYYQVWDGLQLIGKDKVVKI